MPVTPEKVDPGKYLKFERLPPREAILFLEQKGYEIGFAWQDIEPETHKIAFTLSKITQMDVLADIYAYFLEAQQEGLPFQEILAGLQDALAAKGWWGEKTVTDPVTGEDVQVKITPWRLRRAFDTNLRTAHGEGQWARAMEAADDFPYLIYDACNSHENREEHCAWDRLVFPVESNWVKRHIPTPKEWGCKCRWYLLTEGQVKRRGLTVRPGDNETYIKVDDEVRAVPEKYREWENPRTGRKMRVPMGVHPAFNVSPGGWLEHLEEYAGELKDSLPPSLRGALK